MIVASDGSGDFRSLQEAVDAIPADPAARTVIHIRPGVYRQKVTIDKPLITLIGESAENTVLTWDDGAARLFPDGSRYGTFNSYTVHIGGDGFTARGITFENAAGDGRTAGQAIAASVLADRAAFYGCRFLGCQDTLFTGPLPPSVIEPGGFRGPDENKPRKNARQYYEKCFIRGDIDFIFGSATAVFSRCELSANERGEEVNGFVTAASTPEGRPYGYVFLDCDLTGDARPGSFYLGRPWRDFARTVFIRCRMGAHIRPEGFHDWNKPEAAARTVFYAEYGSSGPGAPESGRADFVRRLTPEQAAAFTPASVLGGPDGWDPSRPRDGE